MGVALLHPSVSSLHAELECSEGRWRLHDRGSLNGTFVAVQRIRRAVLVHGVALGFGEVRLWFSTTAPSGGVCTTGPGRTNRVERRQLAYRATVHCEVGIFVVQQRSDGGIVCYDDAVIELARLEFGLLQLLCERRAKAQEALLAYVPWHELANTLAFKSHDADSENVRELVRRVRKKLEAGGLARVIESRQGTGYRVAGVVEES